MLNSYRRNNFRFMLALVALALLLAIALPLAALAISHDPEPPPVIDDPVPPPPPPPPDPKPSGGTGEPPPPPQQPTTTPTTMPTPDPGDGMMTPTPTPDMGGGNGTDNGMMTTRSALSSNSIVSHAATPAQLVKSGGGLQYYFIGADGSASTGPVFPSFSELAETYSGDASLYSGSNPYTFKPIEVDYLAASNQIRVSTYYPDSEYDTNKPYIFTVDADHSVTHQAW